MSLPPSEIPLGAMRFSSDSHQLEYWNGTAWFQIKTFSPNLGDTQSQAGARGVFFFAFDNSGSEPKMVDYITIPTQGNAIDFGDIGSNRVTAQSGAGTSNNLRGVTMGGFNSPNQYSTTMEYVNIATTGNSFDFGYLSSSRAYTGSCSDSHGGLS